jgi:hypothetical protein
MKTKSLPPTHPGKILLEEFLEPMGITQYRLAKDTFVSPRRINEILITIESQPFPKHARLTCRKYNEFFLVRSHSREGGNL